MPTATKTDVLGLRRPTIPAAYPALLLELLAQRGIAAADALRGTRLRLDLLERADACIRPSQWGALVLNAIRLSRDKGLGYALGLHMRTSVHGFLGYASMTAPTLRHSLRVTTQFLRMRIRQYRLLLSEDAGSAQLELREMSPVPALQHPFMFECVLVGIARDIETLTGQPEPALRLEFRWPQPDYYLPYRKRLPSTRFGASANRLCLPAKVLDHPLLLADSITHRQALAQVEREYATVHQEDGDVLERARAELVLSPTGYPDLAMLADRLRLSPRSLRRKLVLAGLRYRELLEEARYRDARRLLEASDLDLQTIAARLDFRDPANFTRAFRRWSGYTPSEFRQLE